MPRLWSETIQAHRRDVREAVLDTAADLVAARGLRSVTMSEIAEETGIARATLYRYFTGVEEVLRAWHERRIADHFEQLAAVRDAANAPGERLSAFLEAFALIVHGSRRHHNAELAALLHRDEQVVRAERQLHEMLRELLAAAAEAGEARADVPPDELAAYCFHALAGAGSLPSKAAVRRLVAVTVAGLRLPG